MKLGGPLAKACGGCRMAGDRISRHLSRFDLVSAKLNASAALKATGALPENVNYAVKSSYLLKLTGIRAGSVGEVESAGDEGAEV